MWPLINYSNKISDTPLMFYKTLVVISDLHKFAELGA